MHPHPKKSSQRLALPLRRDTSSGLNQHTASCQQRHIPPRLSLKRTLLHKANRNDLIRLLPTNRLPAHRAVARASIAVLLARNQSLRQALVAVNMAAVRDRRVGEALHADDALSLADFERTFILVVFLLGFDCLFSLGLQELFFG